MALLCSSKFKIKSRILPQTTRPSKIWHWLSLCSLSTVLTHYHTSSLAFFLLTCQLCPYLKVFALAVPSARKDFPQVLAGLLLASGSKNDTSDKPFLAPLYNILHLLMLYHLIWLFFFFIGLIAVFHLICLYEFVYFYFPFPPLEYKLS